MQILSRTLGEQIVASKVVKICTGTVRIGITAPPEMAIAVANSLNERFSKPDATSNATE